MWPPHEATPSSGRRKRQSASEGGWEPRDRKPIHYRTDLQADCADCFGLCCVALPFARSADFAVNKPAGKPCSNLQSDVRCGIHAQLRDRGYRGCAVFDCFGAGQKTSQVTFGGTSWRDAPEVAESMFEVFPIMRQLHELIWYITEALDPRTGPPRPRELAAEAGPHRRSHRRQRRVDHWAGRERAAWRGQRAAAAGQ